MSSETESIAVVVVTHNSRDVIEDLIVSLDSGLRGIRWHLIVVDNASTDGVVDLVRRIAPSALAVETGRNGGYAAGINAGVRASPGHTAILVLNPDVRLQPGCVSELLRGLRQIGTGIAVPRLTNAKGQLILSQRREPTTLRALGEALLGSNIAGSHARLGELVTDPRCYDVECVVDWAEGSTLLVSAECWTRCGQWDESFFLYSEETDFALRAGDAGLVTRYVPSAHAIHLEGGSGTTPGLWSLLALNRVRLFRRRNGVLKTVPFWCAVLLRESTRALCGKRTSRAAVTALISPARFREAPGPDTIRPRGRRRAARQLHGST
jgi:N-acetylglucosaminyl-diphospho-decaprenol L-rhamnosyltransferase